MTSEPPRLGEGPSAASRRAGSPPALFAIDVDGTLLTSTHEVTAATAAAVQRVRDRGAQVLLTTSRPPRALWPILAALGLVEPAGFIASQGALIGSYSAAGQLRILDRHPIATDLARRVLGAAASCGLAVQWFAGERWLVSHLDDLVVREARIVACTPQVRDLHAEQEGPDKILLIAPDGHPEILTTVASAMPPGVRAQTSNPTYLEITGAEVDKATALAAYCRASGIRRESVVAIGDGLNDLGMLAFAGTAVAPASARAEVRRAAHLITASNDDDGVASALDLLIP